MTSDTTEAGAELAEHEPKSGTLALRGDQVEWSEVQEKALAHIGVDKASRADQQVFMHVAQRAGLDPFAKQIYMIERAGKWTIQTGIDGFRLIAQRRPEYRGQVGPQWCGEDGRWTDVWLDPKNPPHAARVGVLRSDRDEPEWATALFHEYAQHTSSGSLNSMWRQKGAHMIAKCAEALAIRKAFPQELGGLVADEEMTGAGARAASAAAQVQRAAPVTADELTGQAPAAPAGPAADVVDGELVDDDQAEPAAAAAPPVEQDPPAAPAPDAAPGANPAQLRRIAALMDEGQVSEKDRDYLTVLLLDGEVETPLSVAGATRVVNRLNELKKAKHEHGLPGAIDDLFTAAEQQRKAADTPDEKTGDA